ncbi:zinc finger protein 800b [Colossoma macropomum]|uniref:zinc finger protein 800b n=1 Tax=Colossoma macropomum TaxID=42526 RepID=UPI0018640FCC|nr:zinc finger protein 800b [Colossoma macropomum]XP_036433671.1 zinc finger protein 800b [Colossoma macropomum]
MEMEGLSAEAQWTPLNEKSCQTDDLCHEATVPGPDQASKTPVYSVEPGDPSLLQRPLETSKSGIQQIIECFRSGTTQLKHILLKEVDTIFECKLCRSLFRGLPNLITHKEYYCFPRLPEPDEHLGDGKQSLAIKELLEAIYPRPDRQDYVVRLEPIEGNQNAVFQHLIKEDDLESPFPCNSSNHSMDSWKHPQLESQEQEQEHDMDGESDEGEAEGEESEEEEEEEGGEKLVKEQAEGVTLEENKEEEEGRSEGVDEQVVNSGADDVTITCCLCGKDFNSRRSIRRHCHKMHKRRLEELRKFTETRTVPISLFSVVKDRQTGQVHAPSPNGKCCPVCFKTFATKANVCRHFDEVHRGLRRDLITPDIATKPGQLEATPPPHVPVSPTPKVLSPLPQYNLASCKCLLCKRTYSTQARLKRHMRFVHKILTSKSPSTDLSDTMKSIANECLDVSPCPSNNLEPADQECLKRPREEDEDGPLSRKPRLSMGFDFRQLFCKLCKRQFSSRQNLTKHIELHTDNGSDIFIKFYRCPLCPYESRRKRDVLRHITVVHKKNSAYLAKILPSLESRAVKKPAEVVLGGSEKRRHAKEEVNGHKPTLLHGPPKAECFPPSPLVSAKQDLPPPSPPVTRKQSLLPRIPNSVSTNSEEVEDSTEVRVTKNFSLHACDMCGRAFAKKVYLESHKRSHRNAANSDGRTTGVNTRSKSLLGSF